MDWEFGILELVETPGFCSKPAIPHADLFMMCLHPAAFFQPKNLLAVPHVTMDHVGMFGHNFLITGIFSASIESSLQNVGLGQVKLKIS